MVGFKWRTLAVLLQVNNYNAWLQIENSCGLCTKNDSNELEMKNYSNGV